MKTTLLFFGLTAGSLFLAGCQDDTAGSPPPKPMTEAQLSNQITSIENNPKIPPEGKEMAIRQIKAANAMMKSHMESAEKNRKHKTE